MTGFLKSIDQMVLEMDKLFRSRTGTCFRSFMRQGGRFRSEFFSLSLSGDQGRKQQHEHPVVLTVRQVLD